MFVTWVNLACERCKNLSAHEYYHSYWYGRTTKCTICKHIVLHTATPEEVKKQLEKELREKTFIAQVVEDVPEAKESKEEVLTLNVPTASKKASPWKQVASA